MKAKLVSPKETGKFYHDKEMTSYYSVVVSTAGGLKEAVRAYVFASKSGGTVFATVFASNDKSGVYVRGSGRTSGGGYHMASAAMSDAIRGAGFELDRNIDSAGDAAMETALVAMAKGIGYRGKALLVKS